MSDEPTPAEHDIEDDGWDIYRDVFARVMSGRRGADDEVAPSVRAPRPAAEVRSGGGDASSSVGVTPALLSAARAVAAAEKRRQHAIVRFDWPACDAAKTAAFLATRDLIDALDEFEAGQQ